VPKNIVAPKMRSKAPTRRRYSLPPVVQPEGDEHFGGAFEPDDRPFVFHGECCQKDRHDPILPERTPNYCRSRKLNQRQLWRQNLI
jgi:hypothetical protein